MLTIIKRNGKKVPFDKNIFKNSLKRAGADKNSIEKIIKDIIENFPNNATTAQLYKVALSKLNDYSKKIAMQYSLKNAIFKLGPTGFPFEKFIGELFQRLGYQVKTNVVLQGRCIDHEVDVYCEAPEKIAMEIKFHNDMKIRSDIRTVLYVKSRFDDLMYKKNGFFNLNKSNLNRCVLITNTKFTTKAIEYAKCSDVELLGWGYPFNRNIQTIIKEVNAHPITCLPSLSKNELNNLFEKGVTTCRGLLENPSILNSLKNSNLIKEEASLLCIKESRQ